MLPPAAPASSSRLLFLDGMRGLASVYVVLHHACQIYQDADAVPRYGYYPFIPWLLRGRAVAVFMVLSGFCLMLPVAKSASGQLRDGFLGYLHRRFRRILPAYYVSLAIVLALIAFVPALGRGSGDLWRRAVPAFGAGSLISHALLLHWLSPDWIYKINPPLWTLGTEWLLYFCFPLLLLPVWRRLGLIAMLVTATVISFGPRVLLHGTRWTFDWCAPWFIGLFAMGMAAAVLHVSPKLPRGAPTIKRLLRGPIAWIVLAGLFAMLWKWRSAMDGLFGAASVCLILFLAPGPNRPGPLRRALLGALHASPLQLLGKISYSVYLVHAPILMLVYRSIDHRGISANGRAAIMFLFAPAVVIAAAWAFDRTVERPLMPDKSPKPKAAPVPSAATAPTPAIQAEGGSRRRRPGSHLPARTAQPMSSASVPNR
jgi:peptidoglycan/LPS O-acetylase OafA/YrhL